MKYIFVVNPNAIPNMIKHVNRKSINECLLKILLSPNCEILNNDLKTSLIVQILSKFNPINGEESINITEFFLELLLNKNTHNLVLKSEKILNILHFIVQENISNIFVSKDIMKILVKLNEVLLKELNGIATVVSTTSNYDSNYLMSNFLIDEDTTKNEIDLINNQIIFKTLHDTFIIVLEDFMKDGNHINVPNSFGHSAKVLGIKKLY